ncbi:MAG: kynureninase [Flavobacteriales bacterium]|nr:kynureninase [Flavobacteriales bacterium]MBP6696474.1 kynureninase [Flavobacteriales bacterium]
MSVSGHPSTRAEARAIDAVDPLRAFRDEFIFPKHHGGSVVYFTGNSLGLQPKAAAAAIKQELDDWGTFGVEGHFHAKHPWYSYHEELTASAARLVGALPPEVVVMNQLTSNLHFLLVSFYRPQGRRVKILCEQRPFPSDTYAFASQIRFHGLDPDTCLVEMRPRNGEHTLRQEDIAARVAELGDELALVCFGAVNFLTGQAFDIKAITEAAHRVGAKAGFDLAHAAGNLDLHLHDDGPDFACWCGYKYLNSGPGSVAGAFIHQRHLDTDLPRFTGWWGHDKKERFKMERDFKPMPTAEAWQVSNAPVFTMAVHRVALEQFDRAGMARLRAKSERLTGYLRSVVEEISRSNGDLFNIITPGDMAQSGAQLSILVNGDGRGIFKRLTEQGVFCDWREPNVLRMAPVPMYNSFEDVFRFGEILKECVRK